MWYPGNCRKRAMDMKNPMRVAILGGVCWNGSEAARVVAAGGLFPQVVMADAHVG